MRGCLAGLEARARVLCANRRGLLSRPPEKSALPHPAGRHRPPHWHSSLIPTQHHLCSPSLPSPRVTPLSASTTGRRAALRSLLRSLLRRPSPRRRRPLPLTVPPLRPRACAFSGSQEWEANYCGDGNFRVVGYLLQPADLRVLHVGRTADSAGGIGVEARQNKVVDRQHVPHRAEQDLKQGGREGRTRPPPLVPLPREHPCPSIPQGAQASAGGRSAPSS